MDDVTTLKRCAAALSLVAVLFGAAPASHAAAGRGLAEAPEGYRHAEAHRGLRVEEHREAGRDQHHGHVRPRVYWIYPYRYYYPYVYAPAPPTYWYYCESYAAYYPYVKTCPESWIAVPAS